MRLFPSRVSLSQAQAMEFCTAHGGVALQLDSWDRPWLLSLAVIGTDYSVPSLCLSGWHLCDDSGSGGGVAELCVLCAQMCVGGWVGEFVL